VIDGKPICIRRRTGEEIKAVRETPVDSLRDPESDESRVVDPEWVVVSAVCPHAGCEALAGLGDYKGWLCFCHASHFDLSGRIRKGTAEKNLPVVTHCFEDKTTLCLGKVKKK
jgi:ubiquinol-cytochrome c reductase iron-sulfur subunit